MVKAFSTAPPGTSSYLPALLARARAAHPDIPVDPVILQCLLLCLIAQARLPPGSRESSQVGLHLILRTKEEDVGLVVNLVALILQHILGVSPHKPRIAPRPSVQSHDRLRSRGKGNAFTTAQTERPDAFLRSLFFRRTPHTSLSSHRSSTPRPRSGASADTTPRSGTVPLAAAQSKGPRSIGHAPQRSASFPAPSIDGEDEDKVFDAASLASSRRPLLAGHTPGSTIRSRGSRGRPSANRLRTDPFPLSFLFSSPEVTETPEESIAPANTSPEPVRTQKSVSAIERTSEIGGTASALPKAIVVSGLEYASAPLQRALMRVLTEGRVVFDGYEDDETDLSGQDAEVEDGTWNLPDGFVMIYVCKGDPHERPAILRGLLDRFSMSADISLPASVRQSYLAYRAAHTPTPRGTPVPSPLALPHAVHPYSYFAAPSPVHHSPVRRTTPLPALTSQAPPALPASELAYLRTLARPYPTAAPIFYPSNYATTQLHTITPLPPAPAPYAALHPSLDMYLLDLFAATRHHPALDGTLLTMHAHAHAEALARAFRVLNGDTVGAALVYHEAKLGQRRAAGAENSLDGTSWVDGQSPAWRSAESVAGETRMNGSGPGARKGLEEEEFGYGGEDREDGFLTSGDDGGMGEMSPAEALDAAVARAWPEVWDVSEEDVARVFPRVVSHRLRVRDGPDDEILSSVMWPAVPPEVGAAGSGAEQGTLERDGGKLGWERKSVKDILVRILADV